MNKVLKKFSPAVNRKILILLAGLMWLGVGLMLLHLSYIWLSIFDIQLSIVFVAIGIVGGLVVHHFGFLKLADKNISRINAMDGKRCLFSFMAWKNYILVGIMITMGILLRRSPIPKRYLSVIYITIGLALSLSSIRYLRVFVEELIGA